METVVDYLAQEIEREEKLKAKRDARKAGKHHRISQMLKTMTEQEVPDFSELQIVLGD